MTPYGKVLSKWKKTPMNLEWNVTIPVNTTAEIHLPDGVHWQPVMTLEDSPVSQYSYPSVIQGRDGRIHVVYTWRRQRVKYVEIVL